MNDTEKHTALVLRKFKRKLPISEFTSAELSPDLSLIALKSVEDKLSLYKLGDIEDDISLVKQIEIKKCEHYEWIRSTISSRILLVTQVKSGAIIIHQFFTKNNVIIIDEDTTVRPISIDDLAQAENYSEKIIEFRKNSDNAVLRYKIPMANVEKILGNYLYQEANQVETISSVKLTGCNQHCIILHLNHNTLLVLQMLEDILRVKSVIRTEDAKAKILAATLNDDWIFFLESTNRVLIFNTSGAQRGTVELNNIKTPNQLTTSNEYVAFSVSQDLSTFVAVTSRGSVLSIALDVLFREQPTNWKELPRTDDDDTHDENTSSDTSLLRWFDNSKPRPATLPRPWKPLRPVHFNAPKHVYNTSSIYIGDNEVRSNLALNGWNARKTPQPKSISQSAQFLPALVDGKVESVDVNATHIVMLVRSETGVTCCFYSRENGDAHSLELQKSIPLRAPERMMFYFMDESSLCVLCMDRTRSKITNDLIIFTTPVLAERLYELNSWDRRTLRLHALKMGLRYRQLDVIEPVLQSLDPDQQLTGGHILLDFIKQHTMTVQDEVFWDQLLRIGMNFVSLIIDQKSSQAISRLAVSSSTTQVDQDLYGEMMTISKVLDELRQFKINLRHLSMSKTVANDDILYSPWSVAKSKRKSRDETEQVNRLGRIRPRVLFESGTSPTDLEDYPSAPVTPPRDEDDTNDQPSSPTRTPQVKERDVEEDEKRELASSQSLEDLDELALSFGNYRHLWERQSDVQIVQHALVNCNPSLALSYLKWRYQSQGRTMTDMTRSGAVVDIDFNYLKRISEPVIYHAVCQNQFELARKMINSIGEDVDSHFKNIAWKTLRRDVRNVILTYLNDNNKLNERELELIRFLHQLEQFYPNHKYDVARLAALKQQPKITSEQQTTDLKSLDDLPPKIQSELLNAGIEVNTNDTGNAMQESHDSSTYGQWRLTWIDQWDLQTKLRVIVEAALMTDTSTRGEFTQDKQEKDFISQLSFYLSHNMWRKLASWVHDIDLSGYSVNAKGKLERKQTEDDEDDKHRVDLFKLIEEVLPREISSAAGFVKEMLYSELAAVGVFTKEETDATFSGAKTKILPPVLERLAKVNQLFGEVDGPKSRRISPDQMLPYGHIAPLHVLFVRYCILNEFYSILTAYLDTYQLATTEEQVNQMIAELNKLFDTSLDQDVNRRWARLLFSFRAHKNLFELSILNAKAWFKVPANKDKSFSVNSMFASQSREKRPLMALSTLMYAPMQLRDIWDAGKGDVHYVDKAQMNDFLKKYPLLREVFFPDTDNKSKRKSVHDVSAIITPTRRLNLLSGRRDVNLYALLQNEPFHVDKILQPNKDASTKVLSFNDAEFDSERFVDNIDIPYYLVNGQPFHAYQLLMSKGRAALQQDELDEGTNKATSLSIEEMMLLMKVVKVTAFLHMFDDTVVAACISFLELCDMSNEELAIDIEAARRIYQFKAALQQVKMDEGPNEQILEEVILPFLSISKDQGDQTLKEILGQLEESTASMPQSDENASDKTEDQPDSKDDQVLKLNNKWHLVTQFCRVHKLALNDAPLIELAQQNDWVRFLYEAQVLHYPGEQVLRIINRYFTDVSLRQHLVTCVKQMETERGSFVTQQNEEEVQSSDLFELINQARNQVHPGEALLKYAQKLRRPLLAVIAQCFPDVTPLNCMIVWLYASFPTDYFKSFDTSTTESNESPTILKRKSKEKTIQTQGKKVVWSLDSLDTLGRLISILCVKKQFIHLLRAFQLFEPGHLMVHWIKFLQAFVQYRYEESLGHAKQFVLNWRQPPFPLLFKIGDTDWIERWVRDESEQSMMSHIQTPYELGHLLRVLSTVNLHAKYKTLETTCALLSNAGLVDLLFDKDTKSFALPPAETIVSRLAEAALFDDARTVALANELDVDTITVQQAQHTLKQFSLSHFWSIAAERIVSGKARVYVDLMLSQEIWKKVNELFVHYKTSPLVAGDFFYQSAEDMRTEPTSSLTVENLASEKIFLLSLALSWFNGEFNEQIDQHPPASGSGQERNEAWKHSEVLQEIETKMIQVSVASHIPHDITKLGKLPNTEAPSMTTEALEQIIGRLINESGNFAEVEKVCRQFKHESNELVLARTITLLAESALTPTDIPEPIKALYEERYGPKNFDDYDLNELAELLDRLVGLSHHAKQFCERIVVKYKVAQVLSLSFEEINTKDPYEVLRFVLVEGPKKYNLAKSFIVLNQLDAVKVAHVLADGCFQSLTSPDWSTVGTVGPMSMSPMPSSGPSSEHSSMKEADFNSPMKRIPSQGDFNSPMKRIPSQGDFDALNSSQTSLGKSNSAAKIIANVWSARHFSEYVMLCGLPEEVGKELLRHFEMTVYSIPLQAEVDLLIRAHFCFSLAHQLQGTNHILAIVKGRVQQEYVKQKQFKLLVRLITGTKEYTNMQYILDLLVQFNCFEMLLSKNIYIEDDNDKKELQVSLYVFLKTKYPQEIGLMKLLFLRFQMYREYADYSVEKAKEELQSVQSENKPKARVAIHEQSALLNAMASYLDAADYYTKSHCMQMSAQALMQAALIQLQLENLDANVMNLSLDEARKVIMFKGSFVECLVIANAYGLNTPAEWIAPLYQQVITLGNFEFLDDYLTNLPLTSELFRDVVKKYKADPQKNQYQMQIRRFMEYLDDFHLRHQIAIDLGLQDIATAIINLKGLEYFINVKE